MASLTTRPTATVSSDGVSAVPSGSIHSVTADNSDSTFAQMGGGNPHLIVTFGTPSIPAGAVVSALKVRARAGRAFGGLRGLVRTSIAGAGNDTNLSTLPTFGIAEINLLNIPADNATGVNVWFGRPRAGQAMPVRFYALYLDTVYVAKPVVTIDPDWSDEPNMPRLRWLTILDPDGGDLTHYQVAVWENTGSFNPNLTPVFDSGTLDFQPDYNTLPGEELGPYDLPEPLPDGNYHVGIRIAQTVNGELHWSDWDSAELTATDPLAAATGTVLIDTTGNNNQGRIIVDLALDADPGKPDLHYEIERSINGGWATLRESGVTADPNNPSVALDYEAPNGHEVTYRARLIADYADQGKSASDWAQTTGSWRGPAFLKHPSHPLLNQPIEIVGYGSHSQTARQGINQPIGADTPIVTSDTRAAATGALTIRVYNATEAAAIDTLIDTAGPLLIQAGPNSDEPDRYVVITNTTAERTTAKGFVHSRLYTLEWVEVNRPQGRQTGYQLFLGEGVYLP